MKIVYNKPRGHRCNLGNISTAYEAGSLAQCYCGQYYILKWRNMKKEWVAISTRRAKKIMRKEGCE
jgi:hypothetical protein